MQSVLAWLQGEGNILACGLLGFSGKTSNPWRLKLLFMFNESRGGHACGYYSPKKGIVKDNVKADKFIQENRLPYDKLVIGHTRYGTHGGNTPQNAHPFHKGTIIGAHNGVLNNHAELGRTYGFTPVVDSEAIFELINLKGFDALKEIHGTIATAFTTENSNKLHLYRRNNPIYLGEAKEGIYFSSLESSLKAIGIDDKNIFSMLTDTVVTFEEGELLSMDKIEYVQPAYVRTQSWTDYKAPAKKTITTTASAEKKEEPSTNQPATLFDQKGKVDGNNGSGVTSSDSTGNSAPVTTPKGSENETPAGVTRVTNRNLPAVTQKAMDNGVPDGSAATMTLSKGEGSMSFEEDDDYTKAIMELTEEESKEFGDEPIMLSRPEAIKMRSEITRARKYLQDLQGQTANEIAFELYQWESQLRDVITDGIL